MTAPLQGGKVTHGQTSSTCVTLRHRAAGPYAHRGRLPGELIRVTHKTPGYAVPHGTVPVYVI